MILPGGEKDSEGKTTPRSLRKLPHHNAQGAIDMPHLRNAMSRAPQMTGVSDAQMQRAMTHLRNHMNAESGDHVEDQEHTSFTDLVADAEAIVLALGESARKLLASLADADRGLSQSKRQELERYLETFSGLDAVRTDVQRLLNVQPQPKANSLVTAHLLRARLANARKLGVLQ